MLLWLPARAIAQAPGWIDIDLDAPAVAVPGLEGIGIGVVDTSGFPPNVVRYRVWKRINGLPSEDITAITTWRVESDARAAWILQPGEVILVEACAQVRIRVTIPGYPDERVTLRCLGEYDVHGQPPDNNPALGNADVEVGAEDALNMLGNRGIPNRGLRGARTTSEQRDESEVNVELRGNTFGGNRWLDDGINGLTTFPIGTQSNNNGTSRWTKYQNRNDPLIVLSPALAKNLVDGVFRDANGRLNLAVKTLVHEIVHVIVFHHKIKFYEKPAVDKNSDGDTQDPGEEGTSSVDIEEEIAHKVEQILDTMDRIRENIEKTPRTVALDKELKKLMELLKRQYEGLKNVSPDNEDGTDPIDELFEEMEWLDENENGVPDFIERWFEEFELPIEEFLVGAEITGGGGLGD